MLQTPKPVRRGWAIGAVVLACVLLTALHLRITKAHGSDPVVGMVRDLGLVPGQTISFSIGRWWHDTVTACFEGPRLARRNRLLAAQMHALLVQNKDLQDAQAENIRLRALLRFQQKSPVPLLAAEVIAVEPSAQTDTLLLSRGATDGVRPRAVVLAPNGALVGPVLDVSRHSCSVLLLTDAACSVGAQVSRRPAPKAVSLFPISAALRTPIAPALPMPHGPVGICQGDRAGHMTLTYLSAQADVRPGDLVTTSGLGGVYPKGILVGTVETVTTDKARSVKTARLRPAADLEHLEEVFLRLKPAPAPPVPIVPIAPLSPPSVTSNPPAQDTL